MILAQSLFPAFVQDHADIFTSSGGAPGNQLSIPDIIPERRGKSTIEPHPNVVTVCEQRNCPAFFITFLLFEFSPPLCTITPSL